MKKSKFKTIISSIALVLFNSLNAQQTIPKEVKEYGIGLSNFNGFSLHYRWGNETKLKTISGNIGGSSGFGSSNGNSIQYTSTYAVNSSGTSKYDPPISFNLGLYFNTLKFKVMNEKFGLNFGTSVGVSYNYSKSSGSGNSSSISFTETTKSSNLDQSIQPSVGLLLGAYYKISNEFLIYASITPGIYYAYSKNLSTNQRETRMVGGIDSYNSNKSTAYRSNFGFGFGNSGAVLTFVYRFTKKD